LGRLAFGCIPFFGMLHGRLNTNAATSTTTTAKRTIIRFARTSKRNSTEVLYQCASEGKRRNCA
jgi:hypothetical protein